LVGYTLYFLVAYVVFNSAYGLFKRIALPIRTKAHGEF